MANRLLFLGLGAALMYFYDPQAGRRRRAGLMDQLASAQRRLEHGREVVVRDARNRMDGLKAETRHALEAGKREGWKSASTSLVSMAQDSAFAWRRRRWSPAQRALAGAGGAALATIGYLRGGVRGVAMCALGSALVARATANESLADTLRGHGILVEKTIAVDAPVEQVYAYWRNLSNLPLWMSHVREVRPVGDNRWHGVVDGPAGVPVEWDSELLNVEENREMTWHTVGDADVGSVGRVRFQPEGAGTRIHVQMRYTPPGGVVGHAVAKFFGADPRTEMDDDLMRKKSTIETGKPAHDAAAWRREDESGRQIRH
jgi:uncharacterized membrane protein